MASKKKSPIKYEDMKSAPLCEDQLPLISTVGRGEKGDTYKVEIASDSLTSTILQGSSYDEATKTWSTEWTSENINGGQLSYQYNLRPGTDPATFTITFIYRRPDRQEWTWTTPAIPYIWSIDDDGNRTSPDAIIGSGVATLFIKKTTDTEWTEKLIYPDGTTREDYNAPQAEQAWTVNLTFGIGGDIEVPNIDDLAKVTGLTVDQIRDIIADKTVTIGGVDASNLIDYIDKQDDLHQKAAEKTATDADAVLETNLLSHLHSDLGFSSGYLPGDGGSTSVKKYIDDQIAAAKKDGDTDVANLKTYLTNALTDIVNKVYGGGTIGSDGHITWGDSNKIAVGNLNVFATSSLSNYIRTRTGTNTNDVRVI